MWISLFAFATGVAVCLSVAAIISGGLLRDWLRRIRDNRPPVWDPRSAGNNALAAG